MKDIRKIISESCVSGNRNYIKEAVNQILGEDVKPGQTVAVIDDVITGMTGAKGKVKSTNEANPGFVDVELENGTTMPMQASLLIPV